MKHEGGIFRSHLVKILDGRSRDSHVSDNDKGEVSWTVRCCCKGILRTPSSKFVPRDIIISRIWLKACEFHLMHVTK